MNIFDFVKKAISKVGIALGFMAATAVGILGGIDAALMFPMAKLPLGLMIGGSSCFVNSVSYFYVVSQKDTPHTPLAVIHKNTLGSTVFGVGATFFIGTTFVANFVGMYIGFTVLGGKLDLHWPDFALQMPGGIFGVASAVSGLIFNVKVANNLWNRIRAQKISDLPDIEKRLLINDTDSDQNKSIKIMGNRLGPALQTKETVVSKNNSKLTYYSPSTKFDDERVVQKYRKRTFSI